MPRTHKPYDATSRQQAVESLLTSGKPQRQVARDLGLCVETLRDWKQQHTSKPDAAAPSAGEDRRRVRHPIAATGLGILGRAVQGQYRAWARGVRRARDRTWSGLPEAIGPAH